MLLGKKIRIYFFCTLPKLNNVKHLFQTRHASLGWPPPSLTHPISHILIYIPQIPPLLIAFCYNDTGEKIDEAYMLFN